MDYPRTLRELKASRYQTLSVKDELRLNLIRRLRSGQKLFPGIVGYDDTVIPHSSTPSCRVTTSSFSVSADRPKSRIIRQITDLLDERVPIIAGSEVQRRSVRPVSAYGRRTLVSRAT
jgi:magnesium chelatase subunit I